MMRKIITTMIRPKQEYAEVMWTLHKKRCIEIGKNIKNSNLYGAIFGRSNIREIKRNLFNNIKREKRKRRLDFPFFPLRR